MGNTCGKFTERGAMDSGEENITTREEPFAQAQTPVKYNLPVSVTLENITITEEVFAQAQTAVKNNLPVSVTLRKQLSFKLSMNESVYIENCIKINNTLVFSNWYKKQLIICNSDGSDVHRIPLYHRPYDITRVDNNTVAVSGSDKILLMMINTYAGFITKTINTSGLCNGISYDVNSIYVIIDKCKIHVIDLTGKLIRTMPLSSDSHHDITVHRDRLVCIDKTSIYFYSLDGALVLKFENDKYQDLRGVTTDDKGNVYVTDGRTHNVVVVSYNGINHRELLTESDGLICPTAINFDKKENILLVCNDADEKVFLFDVNKKLT